MAEDTRLVEFPPNICLDRATIFIIGRGYTIDSESSRSVTFARRQAADMWITCALMVLSIVPGLLYYSFAKGKQKNTTIVAVPEVDKTRLSYSSDDWIARWPVHQFLTSLLLLRERRTLGG